MPVSAPLRLSAALFLLAIAPAAPSEEIRLPAPGGDAWQPLALPRVERRTAYVPFEAEGVRGARAESECAASALVLPLEGIDLRRTPRARWRWRVVRSLDIDDERTKEGDDFAARVYVMFPFEPGRAGRWARLRRRLAEALFGDRVPGSALNYVWSSREPAGARWDNPFVAESKMISLGPAPPGAWREAEVDVRSDYQALFGHEPPQPFGLAIMTDSDNSCQAATAEFADFRLLAAREPRGAPSGQGPRNLESPRRIAGR